jgi:acyl phosphate:glycerol-3-phosphate acyltransferase
MIVPIVTFLMAYLIGSIPTAVWVGRAWFGIDVREHGSKNAGATNTFRVLGKKPGVFVLLIDVLKGVFAVVLPMMIWHEGVLVYGLTSDRLQILAAIAAVVGHIFPVFAGFRGGKGVATSLGVMIGILPLSAAVCLGIFIVIFILSKYVSLGAICAAFCFPFSVLFLEPQREEMFYFSVVLSLAVIWAHKKNIRRLLKGEENKMNLFA